MRPAEYLIEKRRYDFFHRTDLEHVLDTYDVDTVLLVGFMTNVCVHYTAHGAHERDYLFRAVEECTAAPTRDLHEAALRFMRYLQPRGVPGVEAVLAALSDYGGNPLVRRVKETGRVTDRTGPVRDRSDRWCSDTSSKPGASKAPPASGGPSAAVGWD